MACSRGKAAPNAATKLKLFTDSAGFCQNPACNRQLFPEGFEDYPHLAEMAHIFAAVDGGPRTDHDLSEADRGAYDNIILLCANCHTMADKVPEHYTAELMQKWKEEHKKKRERAFGVHSLNIRGELRAKIQPLLLENAMVHREIGPDNEYRFNPEAAEATAWKKRLKSTIIPNSLRIIDWLDANSSLLTEPEVQTRERFRFHVQGLLMRHLEGQEVPNSRFPAEMENIAV
ncbi:hypothetical protein [Rhizobium sp. AG855]|uniref:hypothetical protein n=1 Tax=Rhizobium sp. AG855 TaxID=2183898 RepID=UPI000E720D48|nr:hypothetical protein [Rhizobium sp. AG855]RKE85136.1 hypothetical protein DFO46_1927 [Rhizobium sp. AG855]